MKSGSQNSPRARRTAYPHPPFSKPTIQPINDSQTFAPLEEPSDTDDEPIDLSADDDDRWDVFIPDDDERDPFPDPRDFWGSMEPGAGSREPD